jgi:LytS/YehU family sensor histidine kinase
MWARKRKGIIDYNPQNINLSNVLLQNIEMLDILARNKQITIVNNIEPQHSFFADINAVSLIFRNLMGNAIKFTQPNGQIVIFSTQNNNKITIGVQDNGVGLSADKLKKFLKVKMLYRSPVLPTNKVPEWGLNFVTSLLLLTKAVFGPKVSKTLKPRFTLVCPKAKQYYLYSLNRVHV